jgi:molybdopterin molybdotransferase
LSGGVSAGKRDLVPDVLEKLGVRPLFHKVAMKPGKPVLFGIRPPQLVFGLPGNPVSSLVCFELFVRPALRGLMAQASGPFYVQARLGSDFAYQTDRPTYHPARLRHTDDGWRVEPLPWFGSADLRGVASANAFALVGPGEHRYTAGQALSVLCVEELEPGSA